MSDENDVTTRQVRAQGSVSVVGDVRLWRGGAVVVEDSYLPTVRRSLASVSTNTVFNVNLTSISLNFQY